MADGNVLFMGKTVPLAVPISTGRGPFMYDGQCDACSNPSTGMFVFHGSATCPKSTTVYRFSGDCPHCHESLTIRVERVESP